MRILALLMLFAAPAGAGADQRAPALRDITPEAAAEAPVPVQDIQPAPPVPADADPLADERYFNSYGTADALRNFGMGEETSFEKLKPGSFVNINRDNGTGHAVTFIAFINSKGAVQPEYNSGVVGFKYFSSQGGSAAGQGGFDYRSAVFSKFGCPEMPGKRDCGVIYSADRKMLNTGTMLAPKFWKGAPAPSDVALFKDTVLDEQFFGGVTTDD